MSDPEADASEARRAFVTALAGSFDDAVRLLTAAHAADAGQWLLDVPAEDRSRVFLALSPHAQAEILRYADEYAARQLAAPLGAGALLQLVAELPSDDAIDVLALADEAAAAEALRRLEATDAPAARELRKLLAHEPDSAGGVMATEFVAAEVGQRIGDVVKEMRKESDDAEPDLGVFVLDRDGKPVGYLTDRDLLTTPIHTPVEAVMAEPFLVKIDEDQEEAAHVISKYGLESLAVVDDDGRLVGVISSDDAATILEEETEEDFALLVGAGSEGQQTRLPLLVRVRQRLPLMALTVFAGLASAKILALLGGSGEAGGDADSAGNAAILRYLPLIIGLAGNVGIQSSTIIVRGFATGEIERERERRVLLSEWSVGSLIGLICGAATWLVASWLEPGSGSRLSAAVGVAVAVAVAWAALLGGSIPLLCRRFRIDPAIVAGPFLIALSDVSGCAIYLAVAKQLLAGSA